MAIERVRPLKFESAATGGDAADDVPFPQSLDPLEDFVDVRGISLQDATSDESTTISRTGDDMVFKDSSNPGGLTLSQLVGAGAGVSTIDFLLDNEPVTPGITYTPTYSGGKVTAEEWKRTSGSAKVRSIDYTYSFNRVSVEVRKVWDTPGTTIIGQQTWTYSYSGSSLASAVMTRDI
jgi:hypothetical protein